MKKTSTALGISTFLLIMVSSFVLSATQAPSPSLPGAAVTPSILGGRRIAWNRTIDAGLGNIEVARGVVAIDQGIYVVGWGIADAAKGSDFLLVKLDRLGHVVWNMTYGTDGPDAGWAIAAGSDGLYLCGVTRPLSTSERDATVYKVDFNGNLLWNVTWGANGGDDYAYGIATCQDGFIITGKTGLGTGAPYNAFVTKYYFNKTQAWNATWGGDAVDSANGIVVDATGNIYACGTTASYSAVRDDAFLLKYWSNGTLSWQQIWGGPGIDTANGVSIDGAGNPTFTGSTNSTLYATSGDDIHVTSFYPNGTFLITTVTNQGSSDTGYGIDCTSSIAYVACSIRNDGGAEMNGFLDEVTPLGAHAIDIRGPWGAPAPVDENFFDVAVETDGVVYLVGTMVNTNQDMLVVKIVNNITPQISHEVTPSIMQGGPATISWVANDTSTNETSYVVDREGVQVASGSWVNGVAINIAVNTTIDGTFNYSITIIDGLGMTAHDTVLVVIQPTTWISVVVACGFIAIAVLAFFMAAKQGVITLKIPVKKRGDKPAKTR